MFDQIDDLIVNTRIIEGCRGGRGRLMDRFVELLGLDPQLCGLADQPTVVLQAALVPFALKAAAPPTGAEATVQL